MGFWSGERLALELPKGLISDFDPNNLDYATYRLCVGEQAFVTADKFGVSAPSDPLISVLGDAPNHTLRIPPGQFAFLLTHETVKVPSSAIALISMRATYKFKGLINVSGFHVDPGWEGKLLFSVYNAGASEVIIKKLDPLFLIVYADLDQDSKMLYRGASQHQKSINPSLLEGMTGQVFSPLMLQRKMETLEQSTNFIKAFIYGAGTVLTLLLAAAALSPNLVGAVLAKSIEAAGYELKGKSSAPEQSLEKETPPPMVTQPRSSAPR